MNCLGDNPKRFVDLKFSGLGLGYLVSFARSHGFFDDVFKIVNAGSVVPEDVKDFAPDIVGLSSVSQNFSVCEDLAFNCKQEFGEDIPVVVGGVHVSALPQSLSMDMDIGIIGEGEATFVELLKTFDSHGWNYEALKHVNGIAFWDYYDGCELYVSPPRDLINPLDCIPFPSRDLLPEAFGKYYMFTSRGCPYNCRFCSSSVFWGCRARFHSAEYVLSEIEYLVYVLGAKEICFYDDLFVVDAPRLFKIRDLIVERGIKCKFSCSVRSNLVSPPIVKALDEMGVRKVSMGLESGDVDNLAYLKGCSVTVEDNFRAVKLLRDAKFGVGASFVVGVPNETYDSLRSTIDFIEKSGVKVGETYTLVPYPATKVWDEALERGLVSDEMDWNRLKLYFDEAPDRVVMYNNPVMASFAPYIDGIFRDLWKKLYWRYVSEYVRNHPDEAFSLLKDLLVTKFRLWWRSRRMNLDEEV